MYFRFAAVVSVLFGLAIAGIAMEKRNVALRRAIGVQEYRRQQLQEQQARLRLEIQRLTARDRAAGLPVHPAADEPRR